MNIRSLFAGSGLACIALLGFGALAASEAEASVFVSAADPALTPLGTLIGGSTYRITATGIANLVMGFNGGVGATFDPDGKPTYSFPAPLESLYPNGSDTDPQNGSFGAAGPGKLLGALVGTFSAVPTDYAQVFTIGKSLTIRASVDETLYAIINDDYYPNNDGFSGYTVSISTVPLPAALPSFGAALLVLGAAGLYRRQEQRRHAMRSTKTSRTEV